MSKNIVSTASAYFSWIARQTNIICKPISLVKQKGVIPGGFSYNSFNGGAKVKPEAILSNVENIRALLFNMIPDVEESFLDIHKLIKDYFIFINSSTMQVEERLYYIDKMKGPLLFEVELEHLGKTSTQVKTTFYLDGEKEPVVVSRVSHVLVCTKTRKPKPPPVWWVDKFKSQIDKNAQPIGKLEFSEGDDSRATKSLVKISMNDVDSYRHTNWCQYLRFCHEAFGEHRMAQEGVDGCEEFFHRGIKNFSFRLLKESSFLDLITVVVSPDKEKTSDIDTDFNFTLLNQSKDVVCQSRIEYYPKSNVINKNFKYNQISSNL